MNVQRANNLLQRTVKSVTIFAVQKYVPLLPAAEQGVMPQEITKYMLPTCTHCDTFAP